MYIDYTSILAFGVTSHVSDKGGNHVNKNSFPAFQSTFGRLLNMILDNIARLFLSTLTLLWATIVAQNKPSAACCGRLVNSKKKKKKFFFHFCSVVSFDLCFIDC